MFDFTFQEILVEGYGFEENKAELILKGVVEVGCDLYSICNEPSDKLDCLNDALQQCFTRHSETERQQMKEKFTDESLREKLLSYMDPFIKGIYEGEEVETKILFGASEQGMETRLKTLVSLEEKVKNTTALYILSGEREVWFDYEKIGLEMVVERLSKLKELSMVTAREQVEEESGKILSGDQTIYQKRDQMVNTFREIGIEWPFEYELVDRIFNKYTDVFDLKIFKIINAPKKIKGDAIARPNTLDTLNQFWEDEGANIIESIRLNNSNYIEIALISSQPHGLYQLEQAKAALNNKPVKLYLVAEGINPDTVNFSVVFDALARTIYAGKSVASTNLKNKFKSHKSEL